MSILANQTGSFSKPSVHDHFRDEPHQSNLYLDSDERNDSSVSISRALYKSELILSSDIYQIGLSRVHLKYNIPTINGRNNTIRFFSSVSNTVHTALIDDGLDTFHTPTTLIASILTALNSQTAASGLVFTAPAVDNINFAFDITSNNGEFQFLTSSHVDRGLPCSGIRAMSEPSFEQRVLCKCFYTSYIDFASNGVKQGQTRSNCFGKGTRFSNSEHIHRQHINIFFEAYNDITIDDEIHNITYNKVRQRNLTELEIVLYDEFGDILYSSNDIPYLSYSLAFRCLS